MLPEQNKYIILIANKLRLVVRLRFNSYIPTQFYFTTTKNQLRLGWTPNRLDIKRLALFILGIARSSIRVGFP